MNPFPGFGKLFQWIADFEYVGLVGSVVLAFAVGFYCGHHWSK